MRSDMIFLVEDNDGIITYIDAVSRGLAAVICVEEGFTLLDTLVEYNDKGKHNED